MVSSEGRTDRDVSPQSHQPSSVVSIAQEWNELSAALRAFLQPLLSQFGPNGGPVVLQSVNSEGHSVLTQSGHRYLNWLVSDDPFLRVVIHSCRSLNDFRLYSAILAAELFRNLYPNGVRASHACQLFQQWTTRFLSAEDCPCRHVVDLNSLSDLTLFAKSALAGLPLSLAARDHVTRCLLQAVVNSMSLGQTAKCRFWPVVVRPMSGWMPEESVAQSGFWWEMESTVAQSVVGRLSKSEGQLKVVFYTCSIAGDEDGIENVTFELQPGEKTPREAIEDQLRRAAKWWMEDGVAIVACQKVIHPSIKRLLRVNGILPMERLSILNVEVFRSLTGTTPLGSIWDRPKSGFYGAIDAVSMRELYGKHFLQLRRENDHLWTVFLCHSLEECALDLKVKAESMITNLQELFLSPSVLCGGGCVEATLAVFWLREAVRVSQDPTERAIAEQLSRCLLTCARVLDPHAEHLTSRNGHHWMIESTLLEPARRRRCVCNGVEVAESELTFFDELRLGHPLLEAELRGQLVLGEVRLLDSFKDKCHAIERACELNSFWLNVNWIVHCK